MKIQNIFLYGIIIALIAPWWCAHANLLTGFAATEANSLLPLNLATITIFIAFMKWILSLLGIIAVISIVIAGIMYMTAGGSTDQVEKAKNAIKYAIVGIIIGLSGLILLQAVERLLQGKSVF